MQSKSAIHLAAVVSMVTASSNVGAALIDRGGGLIYDTELDITWLADANHGVGSTYDAMDGVTDGRMSWQNALEWTQSLVVGGVGGWRLPNTAFGDSTCTNSAGGDSSGYNCRRSEMGNLFYISLGGMLGSSIHTTHNSNYQLFSNIQSAPYWSATEHYAYADISAWDFNFGNGSQGGDLKMYSFHVWAVHDGDVAAVPLPAATWLFGSGLVGLLGYYRRLPSQPKR